MILELDFTAQSHDSVNHLNPPPLYFAATPDPKRPQTRSGDFPPGAGSLLTAPPFS